jgi:hypothetical protein
VAIVERNNKDVVIAAIYNSEKGESFLLASPEIRNDKDTCLEAFSTSIRHKKFRRQ